MEWSLLHSLTERRIGRTLFASSVASNIIDATGNGVEDASLCCVRNKQGPRSPGTRALQPIATCYSTTIFPVVVRSPLTTR